MRPFLVQFRYKLKKRLSDQKVSIREYALHIGRDRSTLSRILRGEIPLPEQEWKAWAEPMGLTERETELFRQDMALAAMSDPAQQILWELFDYIEALEGWVDQVGKSATVLRAALNLVATDEGGRLKAPRPEILVSRRIPIDPQAPGDDDDESGDHL